MRHIILAILISLLYTISKAQTDNAFQLSLLNPVNLSIKTTSVLINSPYDTILAAPKKPLFQTYSGLAGIAFSLLTGLTAVYCYNALNHPEKHKISWEVWAIGTEVFSGSSAIHFCLGSGFLINAGINWKRYRNYYKKYPAKLPPH